MPLTEKAEPATAWVWSSGSFQVTVTVAPSAATEAERIAAGRAGRVAADLEGERARVVVVRVAEGRRQRRRRGGQLRARRRADERRDVRRLVAGVVRDRD